MTDRAYMYVPLSSVCGNNKNAIRSNYLFKDLETSQIIVVLSSKTFYNIKFLFGIVWSY